MTQPQVTTGCACCAPADNLDTAPNSRAVERPATPLGAEARLQLALNVPDLAAAIDFYTQVLGVEAHKERPGYANFEVLEPPLKLVLFEAPGASTSVNHLGIEGFDEAFLRVARNRLESAGLATEEQEKTVCCHAEQNKVVTYAPDGIMFEFYRITDDAPA